MSTYCEISESLVRALSSCPATDVVAVNVATARAGSVLVAGVAPQGVLRSSAVGSSAVSAEAYTPAVSTALAVSRAVPSVLSAALLSSSALSTSRVVQCIEQVCTSLAVARGEAAAHDAPVLLVSVASGASSLELSTSSHGFVLSRATARGSVLELGILESVAGSAAASSSADAVRVAALLCTEHVEARSEAYASGEAAQDVVVSTARAGSVCMHSVVAQVVAAGSGRGASYVYFTDPAARAVLMNTESAALSWYDNYGFESLISWQGKGYAVGVDGIYELTGDTDAGEKIKSRVISGFTDFSAAQTKRLDNMYFGYTSPGQLAVTAEVLESGSPPVTYLLEPRTASAPRNSRVTPGKGLWGRYWRLAISNVDGVDFEVRDASVDIAVSARRV